MKLKVCFTTRHICWEKLRYFNETLQKKKKLATMAQILFSTVLTGFHRILTESYPVAGPKHTHCKIQCNSTFHHIYVTTAAALQMNLNLCIKPLWAAEEKGEWVNIRLIFTHWWEQWDAKQAQGMPSCCWTTVVKSNSLWLAGLLCVAEWITFLTIAYSKLVKLVKFTF